MCIRDRILKAKKKLKKSRIFLIKDLTYVKHDLILDDLLKSKELLNPIEIRKDTHTGTMGANGVPYIQKDFVVFKGSRRVTTALKLGYTHIEGVIID